MSTETTPAEHWRRCYPDLMRLKMEFESGLRPTDRDIEAAYWAWKQNGRDEPLEWFVKNWRARPGLREFVEREVRARG